MTNKEAISIIRFCPFFRYEDQRVGSQNELYIALKMAIAALEKNAERQ